MTQRVAVIAFDNCHASGVSGPLDLLHSANAIAARIAPGSPPPFEVAVLSPAGASVRAGNGYPLAVDGALVGARPAIAIVPGISLIEPEAMLAAALRLRPLGEWLATRHADGTWIAAACSAAFLLAEAGLLEARRATTTTWYARLFEERYPQVKLQASEVLVESDRLVTGGGPFSHVDLTLHVVERFAGKQLARLLARYMVLDNRRDTRALELIPHHVAHHDPLILKAEKWMRSRLHTNIGVQDIASHVAVSPRTLARRFKERTGEGPAAFLQRLRLETAKGLLLATRHRIEAIPARVGYQDESAFRRLFKKHVGVSPREYRRSFAAPEAPIHGAEKVGAGDTAGRRGPLAA